MLRRAVARHLEHVEMADQVRLDIGVRILDRIAHARLRAEMDDAVERHSGEGVARIPASQRNRAGETESRHPIRPIDPAGPA